MQSFELENEQRVEKLQVNIFESEMAAGRAAATRTADIIRDCVGRNGRARVVFATGNSQVAFVEELQDQIDVPWHAVTAFHLDEYVGLSNNHSASFARWIESRISTPLGIGHTEFLDGLAADIPTEIDRYQRLLSQEPIDLVCLGIGENGHLAFNEPDDADGIGPRLVRVTRLTDASVIQQVNEGHFATPGDVPTHAMTLTISLILSARYLQVTVPEQRKAWAVHEALTAPISISCPATYLRNHPAAVLMLDPQSASHRSQSTSGTQATHR